ncbi:MAG: HlyD family efflux transporter periplasmic adaptor subunit [Pseudomonadota bacterium]
MNTIQAWFVALGAFFGFGGEMPDDNLYFGYVEGEYVYVSPKQSGVLETLSVSRGDTVEQGQALYTLDMDQQVLSVGEAEANLRIAEAALENELTGERPEELAVIEDEILRAEAALTLAKLNFERSQVLTSDDFVAVAQLDRARAELEAAEATVAQRKAQLAVAKLPSRDAELEEARQTVRSSEQALESAQIRLGDRSLAAPAAGYVQQTYFLPGEFIQAGMPVVSILPPGKIKFRFFINEQDRALIKVGEQVLIGCDSCDAPIKARVTYISSTAEYTPPVIFSLEERAKLVFLAEALPDEAPTLLPGQPIDVRPAK